MPRGRLARLTEDGTPRHLPFTFGRLNGAMSKTMKATKMKDGWKDGDPELAREVWWRRRGHWILWTFTVASFAMALSGGLLMAADTFWHGDFPHGEDLMIMSIAPIVAVVFAVLYLRHRLGGRPRDLLAVTTAGWRVQTIVHPDKKDSDGDPIRHNIRYLLFTPDVERTISLPLRFGMTAHTGTFTISGGRVHFDGAVRWPPARRRPSDRNKMRSFWVGSEMEVWLEPGLSYDDDSEALLVTMQHH